MTISQMFLINRRCFKAFSQLPRIIDNLQATTYKEGKVMYRVVRKKTLTIQVGASFMAKEHKSVGNGDKLSSSYNRESRTSFLTYQALIHNYLWNRDMTISWLIDKGLMADARHCLICQKEMSLSPCQDMKDGFFLGVPP